MMPVPFLFYHNTRACLVSVYKVPVAGCTWCRVHLVPMCLRRSSCFPIRGHSQGIRSPRSSHSCHDTPRSDIFRYLHRFMCDIDIASCTISRHVCGTRLVCGLACTHAWHVHMHYVCCLPIKLFFLLNISTPSVRSDSSSLRDASYVVTDREKPKQPQLLIKVLHLRN